MPTCEIPTPSQYVKRCFLIKPIPLPNQTMFNIQPAYVRDCTDLLTVISHRKPAISRPNRIFFQPENREASSVASSMTNHPISSICLVPHTQTMFPIESNKIYICTSNSLPSLYFLLQPKQNICKKVQEPERQGKPARAISRGGAETCRRRQKGQG